MLKKVFESRVATVDFTLNCVQRATIPIRVVCRLEPPMEPQAAGMRTTVFTPPPLSNPFPPLSMTVTTV
jgi:hypothetical protein